MMGLRSGVRSWFVTLAALSSTCTVAHADRPTTAMPHHTFGLGFDALGADIGSATANGWGASATASIGDERFHAIGEAAFGRLEAEREAIGHYARVAAGARVLAATVLLSRDTHTALDLVIDAGVGSIGYYLARGVRLSRPYGFAGWGAHIRSLFGHHGGGVTVDYRLIVTPRADEDVARVICRGLCPTTDDSAIDVSMIMTLGVAGW
jgi:hypothetical protein